MVGGVRADGFEWAGLLEDSDSMNDAVGTHLGSGNRVISVVIGSNTGSVSYGSTGQMYAARNPINIRDMVRQETITRPDQAWDRSELMAPKTTGTAAANFGTLDAGALSTAGGTMYAHMFSMAGNLATGSGTLRVEDSSDGTTWAVFTTFLATAPTAAKVSTSGTLDRYYRAAYSSTTAGTAIYAIIFKRG